MANEIRLRANNIGGSFSTQLAAGTTVFIDASFVQLPTIDGVTNHLILILDPLEANGDAEIVRVTNHAAASNTITMVRGAENTSPRIHPAFTTWFHGPVVSDFLHIVTSGTRPAVPYEGEAIYETDTNKLLVYTGTDWASRDAGGQLSYVQVTANQGGIVGTVDLTGLTTTITVPAGRRLKITGYGLFANDTAPNGALLGILQDGVQINQSAVYSTINNTGVTAVGIALVSPSAGSHTYKLQGARLVGGTVTLQAGGTAPSFILVEDIGAA